MNKPKKLYKYEQVSVQSLLNLKNQVMHFGAPANFNDPYDCAIKAKVLEPSDEEVERFRNKYSKIDDIPLVTRKNLETLHKSDLKQWIVKIAQTSINKIAEENIKKRGVTCFSEVNNELLMWSHYANKYTGFCMEFDTSYEPFSRVRKVSYRNSMPALSITDALLNDNYDQFLELYCIKSEAWEYEREWRCIHNEASKNWHYEPESLTAVYFGPEIDRGSLEIICLILQGQNPNVTFWQGKRSNEKFSVEFKIFEYFSHLKAKELGAIPNE
ncbi:MAG: hypothetical protein COC04_02140 [Gammaproteobacteria bacterium]|nr:DUF2971 domain-containing protein [Colwellia sp.]PCH65351.1 MAG: hypothetical protein COC04_02140 [Gammaproteobacteria bacterium]